MHKHFKFSVLLIIIILSHSLKAQLWYNKGQKFYSGPGATIHVQGSFMNDSTADSRHNGLIVIDSSFYNLNYASQQGNGEYDVYGDWINSANFIRDTGFVHLKGALEYIKGDSTTRFYNLAIEGSSRKIMKVNAFVYNYLYLNNLELATDQDTLFIENQSPSAINSSIVFNGEGFISTLDSGCLVRKTNTVNTYYYPLGSIIGTSRFRPLNITPNGSSVNYYACSFQNKNPDMDTYFTANKDSDVCRVNDKFYHTINRTIGVSTADISIGYIKANDGTWNEIGNWKYSTNKWTNKKNGTSTVINNYNAINRKVWNDFSNKPYALINYKPVIDSIIGLNTLCKQTMGTYTAISNDKGNSVYSWSVSTGEFVGDSTKSSVVIKFLAYGNAIIYLTITDTTTGCISGSFTKSVSSLPGPTAGFSLSYINLFKNTPVSFVDSSKNSIAWSWDFGNGINSSIQNPQTAYDNSGTYLIKQVVTDAAGCKDSTERMLDIKCSLKIPNVFSPNSDDTNDLFLIEGMCITDYNLEIFDRWGLLVYKGTKGSSAWDGRTPSGQLCPGGTYYYVLRSMIAGSEQHNTGFITLLK